MCAGAIIQARVGRLVYGADDPKSGGVRSLYAILSDERLNHRVEVQGRGSAGGVPGDFAPLLSRTKDKKYSPQSTQRAQRIRSE